VVIGGRRKCHRKGTVMANESRILGCPEGRKDEKERLLGSLNPTRYAEKRARKKRKKQQCQGNKNRTIRIEGGASIDIIP